MSLLKMSGVIKRGQAPADEPQGSTACEPADRPVATDMNLQHTMNWGDASGALGWGDVGCILAMTCIGIRSCQYARALLEVNVDGLWAAGLTSSAEFWECGAVW